jgi:hypothetical protein
MKASYANKNDLKMHKPKENPKFSKYRKNSPEHCVNSYYLKRKTTALLVIPNT